MSNDLLTGDPKYYKHISMVLFSSFILNAILLFVLNINYVNAWFTDLMGPITAFIVQLFFWGAAGATIAGSVFMASDKDLNEVERIKESPDPAVLRYPNLVDLWLYLQRIISSGFMAVFGSAILFAGLGYFDISIETITSKHRVFLIVFCFLIGLFENRFLTSINQLAKRVFEKHASS